MEDCSQVLVPGFLEKPSDLRRRPFAATQPFSMVRRWSRRRSSSNQSRCDGQFSRCGCETRVPSIGQGRLARSRSTVRLDNQQHPSRSRAVAANGGERLFRFSPVTAPTLRVPTANGACTRWTRLLCGSDHCASMCHRLHCSALRVPVDLAQAEDDATMEIYVSGDGCERHPVKSASLSSIVAPVGAAGRSKTTRQPQETQGRLLQRRHQRRHGRQCRRCHVAAEWPSFRHVERGRRVAKWQAELVADGCVGSAGFFSGASDTAPADACLQSLGRRDG